MNPKRKPSNSNDGSGKSNEKVLYDRPFGGVNTSLVEVSGRMSAATHFESTDHRLYNREGASFDRGETFAGVDYETGLEVVDALRELVPEGATMAQLALRWILMHDGVTAAIPGAKTPEQARANAAAADLAPLPAATMSRVTELYEARIKPLVHQRW